MYCTAPLSPRKGRLISFHDDDDDDDDDDILGVPLSYTLRQWRTWRTGSAAYDEYCSTSTPFTCTVTKLWLIIGQSFANESGVSHFIALAGGDPCAISP